MKGQKLLVSILVLFVALLALVALAGCKPVSGGKGPATPTVGPPAPGETPVPPTVGPGIVEETPAPPPVAPAPPEEVRVQEVRDLEYARYSLDGEEHPLLLDLYLPEPAPRPLPLLLYVHGGGWIEGSKEGCPGEPLARYGYAVACVDYRLARATPEGCVLTFPAQIQDLKAAVRWLRQHADRYGLDPNRFAAIGDSSGGHLAALLGTSAGVPKLAGPEGPGGSDAVQAVVDWYGPVDVTQGPVVFEDDACTTPWDALARNYGGEETPYFYWTLAWSTFLGGSLADPEVLERARMASPLTYVDADDPPFLILHGEADDMVPIEQSERLAEALRRAGVEVTFLRLPEAGHNFGSPEGVLPEFLEPTLAFLDRYLRGTGGEAPGEPGELPSSGKGGLLTHDETWSGEVLVTENVVVPEGVTLTIGPGTVVKFRHYRGYKEGKVGLIVQGGTLKAVGTPDRQIWFTSDAEDPINGDWAGITLVNTDDSRFDYVIVEYAEIGIEQFASQAEVSHSIIRWNNSEGLYAELSRALFEGNTIYGNAYHAIALENYNPEVRIIGNLILGAGQQCVHVEASQALIEGNEFRDFDVSEAAPERVISLMAGAQATVRRNRFEMHGGDDPFAVEPDSTLVAEDNDFGDGHIAPLQFDYRDVKRTELDYLPGSPEDRYLYVFDAEDETRRVVARYGEGLGLAWSIAYADGALWRFTAGNAFVRIDPETGVDYSHEYANPDQIAARGLAYDGEFFWANDHLRRQIIQFRLGTGGGYPDVGSGNALEIVAAFDYPEAVEGGGAGIATDGEYLYVPSELKPNTLLKLDKQGEVVGEIPFEGPLGPAITWDGTYFWTAGGNEIRKWTADGKLVGMIYAPAVETWDLAWGDGYLWTINRTCEEWDDAKVFQIEVLKERVVTIEVEGESGGPPPPAGQEPPPEGEPSEEPPPEEGGQPESVDPGQLLPASALHATVPAWDAAEARSITVTVDAAQTGAPISPYVYGAFIEHQGRCIYGGIWAEMLRDRKFYHPVNYYFPWGYDRHKSPWYANAPDTIVVMDESRAYVGRHSPRVFVDGVRPRGIVQGGLGLRAGKKYTGYVILAATGNVQAEVVLVWGPGEGDRQTLSLGPVGEEYARFPIEFTAGGDTDEGRLEILGRGRGRLFIGPPSLMPADNVQGLRADTLALLKQLGFTVYRWPGGTFANGYDWRKAVGDRDKRPPMLNRAYWSEDVESNDFGLHEFLTLCELVGAEPYIAVSAEGEADVQRAADEVQYLNGDSDTPMGRLRAANGHPQPYHVRFFGVGNEMWYLPLEVYYPLQNKVAQAMWAVDPDVQLIAVGGFGFEGLREGQDWSYGMLEYAADAMTFLSEHLYAGFSQDLEQHTAALARDTASVVEAHRGYRTQIPRLQDKEIRLALDEWNYGWFGRPEIYGEAAPRYYFRDALGIARGLHAVFANSDLIAMVNLHAVNVHGQVKTTKTDAAIEATGLAWSLYRHHFGTLPLPVAGATDPLDVAAAWTAGKDALTIAVVNPTERSYTLRVVLQNARWSGGGRGWYLSAPPWAYNEPGRPPQVTVQTLDAVDAAAGLPVPPMSVVVYALPALP